jgi:hypothetical protein
MPLHAVSIHQRVGLLSSAFLPENRLRWVLPSVGFRVLGNEFEGSVWAAEEFSDQQVSSRQSPGARDRIRLIAAERAV